MSAEEDDTPSELEAARSRRRLKLRFEAACDVLATTEDMMTEEILGCVLPYRDWIQTNLAQAGGTIDPRTFVGWMRSAERDPANYPAPRGAHLIEAMDEALIRGVEDDCLQPAVVVDVLDEWVEGRPIDVEAVDLEDHEDAACLTCGREDGPGVRRGFVEEFVLAGVPLHETYRSQTFDCAAHTDRVGLDALSDDEEVDGLDIALEVNGGEEA